MLNKKIVTEFLKIQLANYQTSTVPYMGQQTFYDVPYWDSTVP